MFALHVDYFEHEGFGWFWWNILVENVVQPARDVPDDVTFQLTKLDLHLCPVGGFWMENVMIGELKITCHQGTVVNWVVHFFTPFLSHRPTLILPPH